MYSQSISNRDANNKRKAYKEKQGDEGGEEGSQDAGEPMNTVMYFGNTQTTRKDSFGNDVRMDIDLTTRCNPREQA